MGSLVGWLVGWLVFFLIHICDVRLWRLKMHHAKMKSVINMTNMPWECTDCNLEVYKI